MATNDNNDTYQRYRCHLTTPPVSSTDTQDLREDFYSGFLEVQLLLQYTVLQQLFLVQFIQFGKGRSGEERRRGRRRRRRRRRKKRKRGE